MNTINKIKTSTANHYIENDILYIIFNDGAVVDLEEIKASKAARLELQNSESMLVFVDIRNLFNVTVEARKYAAEDENSKYSIAMAILVNSLPTRLLTNFFIKFNKPKTPTKMFTSKDKALTWLENFK